MSPALRLAGKVGTPGAAEEPEQGRLAHKSTEPEDTSPTCINHWPAFRVDRKVQLKVAVWLKAAEGRTSLMLVVLLRS